ncbi:MAG: YggT family protein [Gammaproteobacteria bacterium]|nr:YggT family protein [Gammaproteobacteria bacterium]
MNPALDALSFLLGALFSIYAMIVAIRFLMQAFRVDYYNPLAQFVVRLTDPPLKPLRRLIPGWGGYDIAALILCLLVVFLKLLVFKGLQIGQVPAAGFYFSTGMGIPQMVVLAVLDLLNLFFNIFVYTLIIMAVMSWVIQDPSHPVYALLQRLTAPLLAPARRFVPPVGGFDLSVLVTILALITLQKLIMGTLVSVFVG